jgi:uncharacterized protein (TIGR02646 family)
MRKIDRNAVTAPSCLANYNLPGQTWDDLTSPDKRIIRETLLQMQSHSGKTPCCAYCESPLYNDSDGHIEHFRRKNASHFPQFTFAWDNLFFSCNGSNSQHCGHYKDHGAGVYRPADLIKPDIDDPDVFFFISSNGEIRVRNTPTPSTREKQHKEHKAKETIRVFNLNLAILRGKREKALKQYKAKAGETLAELMSWPDESRIRYIQEELDKTKGDPYSTIIRHFLSLL